MWRARTAGGDLWAVVEWARVAILVLTAVAARRPQKLGMFKVVEPAEDAELARGVWEGRLSRMKVVDRDSEAVGVVDDSMVLAGLGDDDIALACDDDVVADFFPVQSTQPDEEAMMAHGLAAGIEVELASKGLLELGGVFAGNHDPELLARADDRVRGTKVNILVEEGRA